jgi:hypothetical protein
LVENKTKKTHNLSKTTIDKQVSFSVTEVGTTIISLDKSHGSYPSTDREEYNKGCVAGWRF